MKKTKIIAIIMFNLEIIFIIFALKNPQASFPWSNIITYSLYFLYNLIMFILFFLKKR